MLVKLRNSVRPLRSLGLCLLGVLASAAVTATLEAVATIDLPGPPGTRFDGRPVARIVVYEALRSN